MGMNGWAEKFYYKDCSYMYSSVSTSFCFTQSYLCYNVKEVTGRKRIMTVQRLSDECGSLLDSMRPGMAGGRATTKRSLGIRIDQQEHSPMTHLCLSWLTKEEHVRDFRGQDLRLGRSY